MSGREVDVASPGQCVNERVAPIFDRDRKGVGRRARQTVRADGKERVGLSSGARARVEQSRRIVEKIIAENRTVYGVNTGFGKLSDVHIKQSQLRELQLNLVRSHSCGLGSPLSIGEARAMLLLRANVLAVGLSGCRPVVIDTLISMLERRVTPVIPEKGSVGASGDLAPLAHLALTVIGEGESFYEDRRIAAAEALRLGLEVYKFEADMENTRLRHRVREDALGGERSGVRGTPTYHQSCSQLTL